MAKRIVSYFNPLLTFSTDDGVSFESKTEAIQLQVDQVWLTRGKPGMVGDLVKITRINENDLVVTKKVGKTIVHITLDAYGREDGIFHGPNDLMSITGAGEYNPESLVPA